MPLQRPFARGVARAVLSPWCRVSVREMDLVPTTGGLLVAANHASHADSIALGLALRTRPLSFLGEAGLVRRLRWVGPHLRTLGMVPLERGAADLDALDRVVALLRAGHAVVVYPEGSRSRTGEVHRPRSGVARLAAAAGVPVVPVGLAGTARLWPVDGRPRPVGGRVHVRFGAPIPAPAATGSARRAFGLHLHEVLADLAGAPRSDALAPLPPAGPATRRKPPGTQPPAHQQFRHQQPGHQPRPTNGTRS